MTEAKQEKADAKQLQKDIRKRRKELANLPPMPEGETLEDVLRKHYENRNTK
jgi:hypothetical protein